MNVCTFLENYPVVLDILAGLVWGTLALGALLAVFIPIIEVSGVPSRLLVDLCCHYLTNLAFRIWIVACSLVGPSLLTFITFQALSPFMRKLACPSHFLFNVETQVSALWILFLFLEYLIALFYLDLRFNLWGSKIPETLRDGTLNEGHPAELLRRTQKLGLITPAIPEYILKNIKFAVGRNLRSGQAVTYGGLLFQPRIILATDLVTNPLSTNLQSHFPDQLLLPILLHEIALIRRRDSFFLGLLTAALIFLQTGEDFGQELRKRNPSHSLFLSGIGLGIQAFFKPPLFLLKFITNFGIASNNISCDTYALCSFVPEIVIHALSAMAHDIRKVPKEHFAFHEQTFDLIERHSTQKTNPAIRARIAWAAQFCTGGGYFKELPPLSLKIRPKAPRILAAVLCILGLSFPLGFELKSSLLYHASFQKKYPPPKAHPKQENLNALSH